MNTILITGGAGYLGSLLTSELLTRGAQVVCLDDLLFGGDAILPFLPHERYRFHKVNACDREGMAPHFHGIDHVVHLAALVTDGACAQAGGAVARRVNVEATQHAFELAEASGAQRFIFASALNPSDGPENLKPGDSASRPLLPSLYHETKLAAEQWLLEKGRTSRCMAIVLRLATLFGISPRTRFDLGINQLVLDAALRRMVIIDQDDQTRSFIHVRDAVRAILLALEATDTSIRNQVVEVSGGGAYTKAEVIEMIRPFIPDFHAELGDEPSDRGPREPLTSLKSLDHLPAFRASISVPEGIRELYEALASGLIGEPYSARHSSTPSTQLPAAPLPPVPQPTRQVPLREASRIDVMREGPLVSIVSPSLNQGRFIEETILSVLNQDYPRIEYLVIDGGSTDGTLEILKKYEGRLTWISEPDRGQSDAINKGFRMARGEILTWLNSDDTLLPGAVRKAVAYLMEYPGVMMVYGEGYQIDENGHVKGRFPWTQPFNLWKLVYLLDYILQQTAFFKRKVFDTLDMLDEGLHWGMDWDLWIRIGKGFRVEYLPEYLANLRQYPDAKTYSGGARRFRELVAIMRRHGTRKFPPAYFVYGFETIWKSLKARIRRVFPGSGDRLGVLGRAISPVLGFVLGKIVLHAQGYYRDGWVYRKAHFLLRNSDGPCLLRLSASIPRVRYRLHPLTIRVCVNGRDLAPATVSPGSLTESWELPDDVRHSGLLEVTVRSNWGIRHPEKGSWGVPGRASFQLHRLEVE